MTPEAGEAAPEISLAGTDGTVYSLRQALSGGPVLLVFFKTTCHTCDLAFPYVNRLRTGYRGGWQLWAVAQDLPERAREYAARYAIDCLVLPDYPDYAVSRQYDPPTTPTVFLIDSDGRIGYRIDGFSKDDLNELSRLLAARLNQEPLVIAPADDGQPAFRPG